MVGHNDLKFQQVGRSNHNVRAEWKHDPDKLVSVSGFLGAVLDLRPVSISEVLQNYVALLAYRYRERLSADVVRFLFVRFPTIDIARSLVAAEHPTFSDVLRAIVEA